MIIKLLSGDLIPLETQSLEEAVNLLRDHLFTSKIRLVDPDTGEEATEPKDLLYAYSLAGDIVIEEPKKDWPVFTGYEELFERVGRLTFRPILNPNEFKEAVTARSIEIDGEYLAVFMFLYLHPLYSDYILLLDREHYRNCDTIDVIDAFKDVNLFKRFITQYNIPVPSSLFIRVISCYACYSYYDDRVDPFVFADTALSIQPDLIHYVDNEGGVFHHVFDEIEQEDPEGICFERKIQMIQYLLAKGANPLVENRLGKTALEWFSDRYPTHAIQDALGEDYYKLQR